MRDKDYFKDKIYCFAGSEVKSKIKDVIRDEGLNMHYMVDEGLRLLLEKRGIKVDAEEPKKPTLV